MSTECLFCKIAGGSIPAEKLVDNEELVAFKDINPVAPVHVLIVPKKHIPTFNDLDANSAVTLAAMHETARDLAKKLRIDETGYRIIINCNRDGGQEIFHLHMHLIGGRAMGRMG